MSKINLHLSFFILISLLFGISFRIVGLTGELWLDEIWNIEAVSHLSSPWQIYLSPDKLDGHSSLWSVILWFLPPGLPDYTYRLPNFLLSIALLLSFALFDERAANQKQLLLFILSISYLLTLYGTEARGYSGMLLFTGLSFIYWKKLTSQPNFHYVAGFTFSIIIGFLFHYSQIIWILALVLTDLGIAIRGKQLFSKAKIGSWLTIGSSILIFYFTVLQYLPDGDGPHPSYADSYTNALSTTLGAPSLSLSSPIFNPICLASAMFATVIALIEIKHQWRAKSPLALLYLNAIFVAPWGFLLIFQPIIFLPRYLLTMSLIWLYLFASFCARQTKLAKISLAIFTVGNLYLQSTLILWGRGNYQKVYDLLPHSTPVLTDHLFRHGMVLNYYHKDKIELIDFYEDQHKSANWLLLHTLDWGFVPQSHLSLHNHGSFELTNSIPSTPLSGWKVLIYKKVAGY